VFVSLEEKRGQKKTKTEKLKLFILILVASLVGFL
jgi:hypothetical protein